MRTVSKKLLSLLLVVILLLSAVPFQAFAADDGDDYDGGSSTKVANATVTVRWFIGGKHVDTTEIETNDDEKPLQINDVIDLAAYVDGMYSSISDKASGAKIYKVGTNDLVKNPSEYTVKKNVTVDVKLSIADDAETYTLTVDANGGKMTNKADTMSVTYKYGALVKKPSAPISAPGAEYEFAGWSFDQHNPGEDEDQYDYENSHCTNTLFGQPWLWDADQTIYAMWRLKTGKLTVNYSLFDSKGNLKSTGEVRKYNNGIVSTNGLLETLYDLDAWTEVMAKVPFGYHPYKNKEVYFTSSKCTTQIGQDVEIGASRTVFVKLVPQTYTIYLDAMGGKVTWTPAAYGFGDTVKLPIPTYTGHIFIGWKDEASGMVYSTKKDNKIQFTFDMEIPDGEDEVTLEALWNDQTGMLLYMYPNKTSNNPTIITLTGKTAGDQLSFTEAKTLAKKYFTSTGSAIGLFDSLAALNEYIDSNGKITDGKTDYVTLTEKGNVYMIVNSGTKQNNSGSGSGSGSSSSSSSSKWDSSNPKTGDNTMLATAASIMILAAVAMITVQALRKKKVM